MFGYLSKLNEQRKKKGKNSGAAIIMVIVAIAFIGMLVSMILYMSYNNYLMKANDKIAKNNFYSAESALALIDAGLQKDITNSMAEAYVMATQMSVGKTDSEVTTLYRRFFKAEMLQRVCDATTLSSTTKKWDVPHVRGYVTADANMTLAATRGAKGVYIDAASNTLDVKEASMVFQNIHVTFVDENGYISDISTDIEVIYPSFEMTSSNISLGLENFAIVANNCLVNDATYTAPTADNVPADVHFGTSTTVKGSVFGGNDGVYVKGNTSLNFVDDTTDSKDSYDLITSCLNVENTKSGTTKGIKVAGQYKNYLGDIKVRSAGVLDLNGVSKVRNDLDIVGNDAQVKLSGAYYGFGSSANDANESSSIMVNGARAELDFSGLNDLKLVGNAFVAASKYDADETRHNKVAGSVDYSASEYHSKYAVEQANANSDFIDNVREYDKLVNAPTTGFVPDANTVSRNSTDVITGQSIAVKADQMMYMVPADCIGFLHGTTTNVIAKNPLSIEEYEKLTTTYKKDDKGNVTNDLYYDLYNLAPLMQRLGDASYHVSVKEVFRRVNGTVMVYLYLDFGSNQFEANRFFQDYSTAYADSFSTYVKSYVKSYKWNSALDSQLSIAGNAFKFDNAGKVVVVNENLSTDDDKMIDLYNNIPIYESNYQGMLHMLTTNTSELSDAQLGYDVFTNLVSAEVSDATKLGNCEFGVGATAADYDMFNKITDDTMLKAKTVVGDYVYRVSDKTRNIKLLVATGDIYLTTDFDGLAIAGGNVYTCGTTSGITNPSCENISYNATDVYSILSSAKNKDGKNAYDIFGTLGVMNYATGAKKDSANNEMSTEQYIRYNNWKKD